jgi:hypothetical protein
LARPEESGQRSPSSDLGVSLPKYGLLHPGVAPRFPTSWDPGRRMLLGRSFGHPHIFRSQSWARAAPRRRRPPGWLRAGPRRSAQSGGHTHVRRSPRPVEPRRGAACRRRLGRRLVPPTWGGLSGKMLGQSRPRLHAEAQMGPRSNSWGPGSPRPPGAGRVLLPPRESIWGLGLPSRAPRSPPQGQDFPVHWRLPQLRPGKISELLKALLGKRAKKITQNSKKKKKKSSARPRLPLESGPVPLGPRSLRTLRTGNRFRGGYFLLLIRLAGDAKAQAEVRAEDPESGPEPGAGLWAPGWGRPLGCRDGDRVAGRPPSALLRARPVLLGVLRAAAGAADRRRQGESRPAEAPDRSSSPASGLAEIGSASLLSTPALTARPRSTARPPPPALVAWQSQPPHPPPAPAVPTAGTATLPPPDSALPSPDSIHLRRYGLSGEPSTLHPRRPSSLAPPFASFATIC